MSGNKLIDLILVGVSFLLTGLVAFFFFYSNGKMFNRPIPENANGETKLLESVRAEYFEESFQLKQVIINLQSNSKRLRFLDVTIYIIPTHRDQIQFLEDKKHIIRDKVIQIASNMYPEELNSISGKLLFENRIKSAINDQVFKQNVAKKIYFTRFVIQ